MRHRDIARRYHLEILIGHADGHAYEQRRAENLAERGMSERDHEKVLQQIRREAEALRDRLVKKHVIEGGVPLPWETNGAVRS